MKQSFPVLPGPQPLATTNLPSISVNLPALDISYEWNHTHVTFHAWLLLPSIMFSRFIHFVACTLTAFLLMEYGNIPLQIHIIIYLLIHPCHFVLLKCLWSFDFAFQLLCSFCVRIQEDPQSAAVISAISLESLWGFTWGFKCLHQILLKIKGTTFGGTWKEKFTKSCWGPSALLFFMLFEADCQAFLWIS